MSALGFTVLDLDSPVGSKNKTATLVTGERDATPVSPVRTGTAWPRRSWTAASGRPRSSSATATRTAAMAAST